LAVEYNSKSAEIAKKYDMQKLLADNLYHQSLLLISRGDYKKAKSIIDKAILIAKEKKYMNNAAKYLDCLGIILRHERKFDKAIDVINEALAITKTIGDKHGLRKYSNSVGLINERIGDFKKALNIYFDCLKLSKQMGEKRSISVSYNNIAGMHLLLGDFNESLKNHKKAFSYAKRINYKEGEAGFAFNISTTLLRQKKYSASLKYLNISINAFESMDNPYVVECRILKAYIYMLQNDIDSVKECYKYIKDINSDNEYGHIRNWELYKINLYLGKFDRKFLNNAFERMQEDLNLIKFDKSKDLFFEYFTYGKLITEEFNKDKK